MGATQKFFVVLLTSILWLSSLFFFIKSASAVGTDLQAPITAATTGAGCSPSSFPGNANGGNNYTSSCSGIDSTNVALTCDDSTTGNSGCQTTYYKLDNSGTAPTSGYNTYSSAVSLNPTNYKIWYYSVDSVNNGDTTIANSLTLTFTYSISGSIYIDTNGDGSLAAGETTKHTGSCTVSAGAGTPSCSNGDYSISGLSANTTYSVTLSGIASGYTITTTNPLSVPVATANVTGKNFGVVQFYSISGNVFVDNNHDAAYNGTDSYSAQTITLTGRPSITSDATTGAYSFTNLVAGTYTVSLTIPANYQATKPTSTTTPSGACDPTTCMSPGTTSYSITLGPDATGKDFGITPLYSIQGNIYEDLNGTGAYDSTPTPADALFANPPSNTKSIVITLSGDSSNTATTTTGAYSFTNLVSGSYSVTANSTPTGYKQVLYIGTLTQPFSVNADITGINFLIQGFRISGKTFTDYDHDGVKNGSDSFSSQTITLSGRSAITSNATTGYYSFENVTTGTYTNSLTIPASYKATLPTSSCSPTNCIGPATTSYSYFPSSRVTGVINQYSIAGVINPRQYSAGEKIVVKITITNNGGTSWNLQGRDLNGNYLWFEGGSYYDYTRTVEITAGANGIRDLGIAPLDNSNANTDITFTVYADMPNQDFGITPLYIISGNIYEDVNGDGAYDTTPAPSDTWFTNGANNATGPGTERVYNPSFEDQTPWTNGIPFAWNHTDTGIGAVTVQSATSHSGSTGWSLASSALPSPTSSTGWAYQNIGVNQNTDYVFSVWVRPASASSTQKLCVITTGWAEIGTSCKVFTDLSQNQWHQLITTFNSGSNSSVRAGFGTGASQSHVFDDASLIAGTLLASATQKTTIVRLSGSATKSVFTATGNYTFTNVLSGSYTIAVDTPTGYKQVLYQTTAGGVFSSVNSFTVSSNTTVHGLVQGFKISGNVFVDYDHNGAKDASDINYSGATLSITNTCPGQKTTDASGNYSFINLTTGTYSVKFCVPSGYQATTTNPVSVTISTLDATADFGITPFYTISGTVFIDINKDEVLNPGEQPYALSNSIIEAHSGNDPSCAPATLATNIGSGGTITTSDGTYTTGQNLLSGEYTFCYKSIPSAYWMTYPKTGSPPSLSVTVGTPGKNPPCSVGALRNASCDASGNVVGLDFGITNSCQWTQFIGADAIGHLGVGSCDPFPPAPAPAPGGGIIVDPIPNPPIPDPPGSPAACGSPLHASIADGINTSPGVFFVEDNSYSFCQSGAVGCQNQASTQGWVVGGTTNPEVYQTQNPNTLRTSYDAMVTTARQNGTTPLRPLTTTQCGGGGLTSCSLSTTTLNSGIYHADSDLTLVDSNIGSNYCSITDLRSSQGCYKFPSNKQIVILVNGDLYINENILVPTDTSVTFSVKGNITVDQNIGVNYNTSCDLTTADHIGCNIEGFYNTDQSFIINGNSGAQTVCATGGNDKRLNIAGSVVTGANLADSGSIIVKRDLCKKNLQCPTYTITARPDFIINAPEFIRHPNFIWKEEAP